MFTDGAAIIMFLINHHFVGETDNDDADAFKSPTSLASQSLLGLARYRPMTYVLIMHVGGT